MTEGDLRRHLEDNPEGQERLFRIALAIITADHAGAERQKTPPGSIWDRAIGIYEEGLRRELLRREML